MLNFCINFFFIIDIVQLLFSKIEIFVNSQIHILDKYEIYLYKIEAIDL